MKRLGYTEGLLMILAALWLLALVLCLGCSVRIVVVHQLKSPVRCKMDHRRNDLGFICDHIIRLTARTVRVDPEPGEGIPPL